MTSSIWGSSFLMIKYSLEELNPSDIAIYRILIGALFINIFVRAKENIIKADVMYGDSGKVDLGYYCYKRGIPFSKYKIITKVLGQKVEEKYGDKIVNIEV